MRDDLLKALQATVARLAREADPAAVRLAEQGLRALAARFFVVTLRSAWRVGWRRFVSAMSEVPPRPQSRSSD